MSTGMFYAVATFTLFIIVCNAQDYTCAKTDHIKAELKSIRKQLQDDRTAIKEMQQGYRRLRNGWVTIFNGYQYKVTPSGQSWDASRSICRSWGGDLAVYGVQDMRSRRILYQALYLGEVDIWIGLNDIEKEGKWVWVNGESGFNGGAFWIRGEPNDFRGNEDCAYILNHAGHGRGTNDSICSGHVIGLCEKVL